MDEVGELPLQAQVKLLRVLQEKKIVRLGQSKEIAIKVRVISATNRNIMKEISGGKFRADLFYRLGVALLKLPPLRERPGDIGLLIDRLLEKIDQDSKDDRLGVISKKISIPARNLLLRHSWPGNVRELYNTLLRAALWSFGDVIEADEMQDALLPEPEEKMVDIFHQPIGPGFSLEELLGTIARQYLKQAIEQTYGNKSKAAKLLGFGTYQTLGNWMKKHGVNDKQN